MAHDTSRNPRDKKRQDGRAGRWLYSAVEAWSEFQASNAYFELRDGVLYLIEYNGRIRPILSVPRRLRHHKRSRHNGSKALYGWDKPTKYKIHLRSRTLSREEKSWWAEY